MAEKQKSKPKKNFFKRPSETSIRKGYEILEFNSQEGLAEKILSLDTENQAIQINFDLCRKDLRNISSKAKASRKNRRHGDYIVLSQPGRVLPFTARNRDFSKLSSRDEIFDIGYCWQAFTSDDLRTRFIRFDEILQGAKLYFFSEQVKEKYSGLPNIGMEFLKVRDTQKRVSVEGATISMKVPSTSKGEGRYQIDFMHIPVKKSGALAVAYTLKATNHSPPPKDKKWNDRYKREHDLGFSEGIEFDCHDYAGYMHIIQHYQNEGNLIPLKYSPFAVPSLMMAEAYETILNNVIVKDETLSRKSKTRVTHEPETSNLLAMIVKHSGPDQTLYSQRSRDGYLREYECWMKNLTLI